jgi:CheY-like chemotaxis protein
MPPDLRGTRVLLVEDDADSREMFCWALEECGASAAGVGTAGEALALWPQLKPQVLVSDISLPDDAFVLARKAKQDGIPSVAVTGRGLPHEKAQILLGGFDMHLLKPVDPDALIEAVVALIGDDTAM